MTKQKFSIGDIVRYVPSGDVPDTRLLNVEAEVIKVDIGYLPYTLRVLSSRIIYYSTGKGWVPVQKMNRNGANS